MPTDIIASSVAGATFGSALTVSGVYLPSVILAQMELRDFHMVKVFLTASSLSAASIALYEHLKNRKFTRRAPSSLGLLGTYDGNVIGGAMVGVGMALTGACPGTVLVQLGTGIPSGRYAMLGGILGGVVYTLIAKSVRRGANRPSSGDPSLPGKLGVSSNNATAAFVSLCTSMVLAARYLLPTQPHVLLDSAVGGALVGVGQIASLLLTSAPVGVSSCYEDLGVWFWSQLGYDTGLSSSAKDRVLPISRSIAFATGIVASSLALTKNVPRLVLSDNAPVAPARAIFGGLVMILGSRLAGGCTSGHGISGMSMLGASSIVSVAAMFGGGMGTAALLG